MPDVLMTVFGVTVLLGLVSLLLPLAQRLSIPYAVLLAVIGVALGVGDSIIASAASGTALGDVLATLDKFHPGAELLLAVFLPPLLFEAALNMDVRQLSDEIGPILVLAVLGVVVCTFAAGLALWPISHMGLLACIAIGAIIATTDPVAVVGIFRDVGAPRRLSMLVEGESLFNDAAAIAIYTVAARHAGEAGGRCDPRCAAASCASSSAAWSPASSPGWAVMRLMPLLRGNRLAETDPDDRLGLHRLHRLPITISGSRASSRSPRRRSRSAAAAARRMAPSNWENLVDTWEQLAFWASSLIFLLAAMQVPQELSHIGATG